MSTSEAPVTTQPLASQRGLRTEQRYSCDGLAKALFTAYRAIAEASGRRMLLELTPR